MSRDVVIPPGEVLGIFGTGQLGRMFAIAAARLGYRVHVFAPEPDAPAADVAWWHTRAAYEDADAVRSFAQQVAGVTYEMENIPVAAAEEAARHVPVSPAPQALALTQDRAREKAFLDQRGLPVAPFAIVRSGADAARAAAEVGTPFVLKSARGGYDGKGQRKVDRPADAAVAWSDLAVAEAVAESWIDFEAELSVIVARNGAGEVACYGPMRNVHRRHILDHSVFPAGLGAVEREARELASAAAEALGLVGVCCVEMFLNRAGALLINEIAPRPHNSGHLTIEAFTVSQFEQQVRTLCGLPLGDPAATAPAAAMANLLGDLWTGAGGEPRWGEALAMPAVSLHLYGKREPRPGRKMGHLTATAASPEEAAARALAARSKVQSRRPEAEGHESYHEHHEAPKDTKEPRRQSL